MKTILIIDDEADIRDILSYNLKKEGFNVHAAENGPLGIKLAELHKPDLILLDVMMPEMDGIEACDGDPCAIARSLRKNNVFLKVTTYNTLKLKSLPLNQRNLT